MPSCPGPRGLAPRPLCATLFRLPSFFFEQFCFLFLASMSSFLSYFFPQLAVLSRGFSGRPPYSASWLSYSVPIVARQNKLRARVSRPTRIRVRVHPKCTFCWAASQLASQTTATQQSASFKSNLEMHIDAIETIAEYSGLYKYRERGMLPYHCWTLCLCLQFIAVASSFTAADVVPRPWLDVLRTS